MERRSVQVLSPPIGPWWGVDYYMNFAIYELLKNGNPDWSTWYPGMHLGLRSPGLENLIVFRDGVLPEEGELENGWEGGFSWQRMYDWYRQFNNAIGVDPTGTPHTLTTHEPPYRSGNWPNYIYDWSLYETGWWVTVTHGKRLVTFRPTHRMSAYTNYQRVCNTWVWSAPTELAIPGVENQAVSEKGHTYDMALVEGPGDIDYFSIETPVNDNITQGIDGVIMGEFQYQGNTKLIPGGASHTFSINHKGERGNFVVWDLPENRVPDSYNVQDEVGEAPLLDPEINFISAGYLPGKDAEDNEIPYSTPDDLNTEVGGAVYRVRFSLSGSGIATPQSITINGNTMLVDATGLATYPIILSMTSLPAYNQFKPDDVPVDSGLIGQLRFRHAIYSPKEDADPEGHPGYVDIIYRDLDLGEDGTPQDYVDSFDAITIVGFSAEQALYTESTGTANYTFPMLADLAGNQLLAESYNGELYHRANTWFPYSDNPALEAAEHYWIESGTSETYLMKDGQKIPCDGTPQLYIPMPRQSVGWQENIAVDQNITITFASTVPEKGYDGSGVPVLICYTEGQEFGYKMDGDKWPIITRNTPRPETAAAISAKLSPGAKVYGSHRYRDGQNWRAVPFRGEVVSSQWKWAPVGSRTPIRARLHRTGMQGGSPFIIESLTIKITEIFTQEYGRSWQFWGDYFPPYEYVQNIPSTSNPDVPVPRYDHGYLYFDGSFRNIYQTGGYTAGQMLHASNMRINSMFEGPLDHAYWSQSFVWDEDYIWRIGRYIDTTSPYSFGRNERLDSEGNVLIPAQYGYFIPRWRIDYSGGLAKCVFDDFQIIDSSMEHWIDESGGFSIGNYINASLDPKILREITEWEIKKLTPPPEPEPETPTP